ncbi:MAG TPA: transcription elongation factor Spt5 [Nitrososphaeraceae archaeon]|nr:transcription elongation factor Spt5 [Nitrososphaeraceae archaeon]
MNANLFDLNSNLEKKQVEDGANFANGSINLEGSASEGLDDDTHNDIQGSKTMDKSNLDEKLDETNEHATVEAAKSKFFAIRITGGQERVVANILYTKITTKKLKIFSILALDNFKGYIIVEAPDANVAYEALSGVRHVRGQIRGELPFKDIEGYLVKKPVVTDLSIDNMVEVIAGPFKAMKAKVIRVDYEKQEATVVLLDSPYQIPVTVDANYVRKLAQ